METYSGRFKVYQAVYLHGIMMHYIAQGTFISNCLLRQTFCVAVVFGRIIDKVVLVSKYHILPCNKADEQYS